MYIVISMPNRRSIAIGVSQRIAMFLVVMAEMERHVCMAEPP
jgi:hypothetical protein